MGVYIKSMGIPTSCEKCLFFVENKHDRGEDSFCRLLSKEVYPFLGTLPDDCHLVPVPPHGRLIDADALTNRVGSYMPIKWTHEYGVVVSLNDIYHAPTIIPSEKEGE